MFELAGATLIVTIVIFAGATALGVWLWMWIIKVGVVWGLRAYDAEKRTAGHAPPRQYPQYQSPTPYGSSGQPTGHGYDY